MEKPVGEEDNFPQFDLRLYGSTSADLKNMQEVNSGSFLFEGFTCYKFSPKKGCVVVKY